MSFANNLHAAVEAMIAAELPATAITEPLVTALARAAVLVARRAAPDDRKQVLEGVLEILRNDLDEAVASYDQIISH